MTYQETGRLNTSSSLPESMLFWYSSTQSPNKTLNNLGLTTRKIHVTKQHSPILPNMVLLLRVRWAYEQVARSHLVMGYIKYHKISLSSSLLLLLSFLIAAIHKNTGKRSSWPLHFIIVVAVRPKFVTQSLLLATSSEHDNTFGTSTTKLFPFMFTARVTWNYLFW